MIDHNPSDERLVSLVQEGSQEAFNSLYARYFGVVYKRIRFVVPQQDVDDVTQEVFIGMLKSIRNFQGRSAFSTWLRALANRQVAEYYRKNRRHHSIDLEQLDRHGRTDGESSADQEEQIAVRSALNKLADPYREILMLRFAENLQFNEIASLQGTSLEAAKSTFRRAMDALRRNL